MNNKTLIASIVPVVVQAIVIQAVLVPIVDDLAPEKEVIKVPVSNEDYIKSYAVSVSGDTEWSLTYDNGVNVAYGNFAQTIASQPSFLLSSDSVCVYFVNGGMKAISPDGNAVDTTSVTYDGTKITVNGQEYAKPTMGYLAVGLGDGAKSIQTKAVYDIGCGAKHDTTDNITVIGYENGAYAQSTQTVKDFAEGEQNGEIRADGSKYDAKADVTVTPSDENYTVDNGKIQVA